MRRHYVTLYKLFLAQYYSVIPSQINYVIVSKY
ncbi:MAG: CtsR family transcriptional regulator [Chlorobiota bacterium]